MTVNEKIVQALGSFEIPVTADFFGGENEEYVTFNYTDDRAVIYGDNRPIEVKAEMQIHYFLPADKDYLEIKKKMRNALFLAGFTYPSATVLLEHGNTVRHIIFECEIENDDELGEQEV